MNKDKGNLIRTIRIITQIIFVLIFVFLFFNPRISSIENGDGVKVFFYFDPLFLFTNILSTGKIILILLLSLIPIFLTLLFGKFFCGWICPFGAINQFFSWIFRKSKDIKQVFNKKILRIKYYVLFMIIASTLIGLNIAGWLDPFSLLTRSMASLTPAGDYIVQKTMFFDDKETLPVIKILKYQQENPEQNILGDFHRSTSQPFLIGGIFILLLSMNFYKRRFFCNALCPLGALYGIFSKFSIIRLKTATTCNSCHACSKNCTYNGSPDENYLKSECTLCFNCVSDCSSSSIDINFSLPKKEHTHQTDLKRRQVISSFALGAVFATLPKTFTQANNHSRHSFLRPPGSIKEDLFLEKCVRCGQCIQSCPTGFIQPATIENGIENLWTPITDANAGICLFDCNKCTSVCPSGAIEELSLKQKQKFKIGTAVIDKNRCYTYADGFNCTVCEEHCPTAEKAIQFRENKIWNFRGKQVKVKQIYVLPDLCIGCGICQNVCPRNDSPGIFISSEEEVRETNNPF